MVSNPGPLLRLAPALPTRPLDDYNQWLSGQVGSGGVHAINSDTIGCGDSARREEEQSTNTFQLVTARLDPERREDINEQQHTRQEEPGVIKY